MIDELLPCPHCGGVFNDDPSLIGQLHDPLRRRGLPFGWMLVCPNIDCAAAMFGPSRDDLIARWNTRKPLDLTTNPPQRAGAILMFDSYVLAQQFKDMVDQAEIVVAPFRPTPEPVG